MPNIALFPLNRNFSPLSEDERSNLEFQKISSRPFQILNLPIAGIKYLTANHIFILRRCKKEPKNKKLAYSTLMQSRKRAQWRPRQESNLHLVFRRDPFYPLNYGDRTLSAQHNKQEDSPAQAKSGSIAPCILILNRFFLGWFP